MGDSDYCTSVDWVDCNFVGYSAENSRPLSDNSVHNCVVDLEPSTAESAQEECTNRYKLSPGLHDIADTVYQ